jgi:orotate phosphoribosyltransferase
MRNGFNQAGFNNFIIDNDIIGFKDPPVELNSGRRSNFYVNWRPILGTIKGVHIVSGYVLEFAKLEGLEPDCYYGVPAGANALAAIVQYRWGTSHEDFMERNYPLAMGREKPKDHGDPADKYFVSKPRGKTAVLEDVATTGGSLIAVLEKLGDANVDVEEVIVLTDRSQLSDDGRSVEEAVGDLGIDYYAMSRALRLLPHAYKKQKPGKRIGRKIEDEFRDYGVEPLKIV